MNAPLWVALPVILLVTLAARADVRTRTIPNALTLPALLLGLSMHAAFNGFDGVKSSLAGASLAFAVLFPGWAFRWMGAGDVKLMAAVGAWLAWPQTAIALLASLVAGGAIALVLAARKGALRQALAGAAWLGAWTIARAGSAGVAPPVTTGIRFPFSLAAFAGATFALWLRT
jgi:prepilin peptidase CpaA